MCNYIVNFGIRQLPKIFVLVIQQVNSTHKIIEIKMIADIMSMIMHDILVFCEPQHLSGLQIKLFTYITMICFVLIVRIIYFELIYEFHKDIYWYFWIRTVFCVNCLRIIDPFFRPPKGRPQLLYRPSLVHAEKYLIH